LSLVEDFLFGPLRVRNSSYKKKAITTMIPRIIHQTSRKLTPEEGRLAHRLRTLLPDWEYRLWSDNDNERLVEAQFPQYLSAYRSIKRGVIKADIARYMYLSALGGFYLDTDYKIVRPIDFEMLSHACVLPISRDDKSTFRLGNAVMGSQSGHPFWSDFIAHIFSNAGLEDLAESRIETTTGPEGLTEFYLARRDLYHGIYLPPKIMFHPPLTLGGFSFQSRRITVGAHLCWGSWRTKNPLGMVRRLAVRKVTSFSFR
jgi:mannosyltransferase OCH1-like enzyme